MMRSDEIPEIGTVELTVPTLGKIKGISYNNEVCQYLGLPYGKIPGRFRRSQPADPWKNGEWDGTKLGYISPIVTSYPMATLVVVASRSPTHSREHGSHITGPTAHNHPGTSTLSLPQPGHGSTCQGPTSSHVSTSTSLCPNFHPKTAAPSPSWCSSTAGHSPMRPGQRQSTTDACWPPILPPCRVLPFSSP